MTRDADHQAGPSTDTEADRLLDVALGRAGSSPFWTDLAPTEPAAHRERGRFRVPAVLRLGRARFGVRRVAAVLSAGAALVALWIAIRSGSDQATRTTTAEPVAATGSEAPSAHLTRPTSDAPRDASIGIDLPEAWAGRCRPAPALDPDADAAVVCEPATGPARVELRRIDDTIRRDTAFLELAGRSPSGTGPSRCALGWPEVRTWSRAGTPEQVAGAYRCAAVAGRSEVVWTDSEHALVARATGRDGDLAALYRWWSTDAPGA